jgi:hypothetical protein
MSVDFGNDRVEFIISAPNIAGINTVLCKGILIEIRRVEGGIQPVRILRVRNFPSCVETSVEVNG